MTSPAQRLDQTSPSTRRRPRLRHGLLLAVFFASLLIAGCSVTYYGQALAGQFEIWQRQRPTAALLRDPDTDPQLRERLELAREILAFAERELHLPHDGNYSSYADLERDSVVWSVFAAPSFDVEPVGWRYPVLGKIDYRGYFRKERAESFASRLREQGLDVAVVGVPAYSTLGWFRDPLLNTFLDWQETDLAALIFHELAHKKYYRKGDTAFSEAFAVAVEEEGVRRWLRQRRSPSDLARWEKRQQRNREFVRRVLATRERLARLYGSAMSREQRSARKAAVLGELQEYVRNLLREAGKTEDDTFWLRDDLNNAHLNVVAAYRLQVPRFEALLRSCDGDLERFYATVPELPSS